MQGGLLVPERKLLLDLQAAAIGLTGDTHGDVLLVREEAIDTGNVMQGTP